MKNMRKVFFTIIFLLVAAVGVYLLYPKVTNAPQKVAPINAERGTGTNLLETGTCSLNEVGLPKDDCGDKEASSSSLLVN